MIAYPLSQTTKKVSSIAATQMQSALFWMRFASNSQTLGKLGETYVNYWLKSQGFQSKDTSQLKQEGDITASDPQTGEIVRFEVKTAKRGTDERWQFCLCKQGHTNIGHSDYVVFLILDDYLKLFRYIVPSDLLGTSSKLSLRTHPTQYRGKIAPFLMRSDDIDLLDIRTTYHLIGV